MAHIECTVCIALKWRTEDSGIFWALQPPGVILCDWCITKIQEFLLVFDLAEEQPFLNLFQGKIDESEDGKFWNLLTYPHGQVTVRKAVT